jgi:hypothetical protein
VKYQKNKTEIHKVKTQEYKGIKTKIQGARRYRRQAKTQENKRKKEERNMQENTGCSKNKTKQKRSPFLHELPGKQSPSEDNVQGRRRRRPPEWKIPNLNGEPSADGVDSTRPRHLASGVGHRPPEWKIPSLNGEPSADGVDSTNLDIQPQA